MPQIVPFPENRRPSGAPPVVDDDPFEGASAQDLAWAFTLAAEVYLATDQVDLAAVASQLALQAAARCCVECLRWAMSVRSNALTKSQGKSSAPPRQRAP